MREYLTSRGLGEEVAREFRLGLSPGRGLAAKAREKGFTPDELRAAGLTNARGNDYFPFRLMFPLADARGRVVGFQARRLRDDDPLRGKYVNTPETELFRKSAILYGLHLARTAIAKQERAVVVEGNTDVIALRQAGFEPVVASMGTALTERQLRELGPARATALPLLRRRRGGRGRDAAGNGARRRRRGSTFGSSRCPRVRTPPTRRSASKTGSRTRRATSCTARGSSSSARPTGRRASCVRARCLPGRPTRRSGRMRFGCSPTGSTCRGRRWRASRRRAAPDRRSRKRRGCCGAGDRLERDALAACVAHPELAKLLHELSPEHFDEELHRRFRSVLVDGADEDAELVGLHAELDARAAREGIDARTGKELLLRLRERRLRRELAGAELERTTELQATLARVRQAIAELA